MFTQIEEIVHRLEEAIPGIDTDISTPLDKRGVWYIDVEKDGKFVVIQYFPSRPDMFGVSLLEDSDHLAFEITPDKFVYTEATMIEYVKRLLVTT